MSSSSSHHTTDHAKKLALVMGVANEKSIAWACVLSFLRKGYDCIITYQDHQDLASTDGDAKNKYRAKIEKLVQSTSTSTSSILGSLPCNVETDLPILFQERIQHLLNSNGTMHDQHDHDRRRIDAVVHSVAYAPEMDQPLLQTPASAYLTAQHVSAYSLIETVRECLATNVLADSAAITTLSYLGAVRSVPGYGSMGPAKAALECVVRNLAAEVGEMQSRQQQEEQPLTATSVLRINAVSAGPIKTVSARGIANFSLLQEHVAQTAPLRRNVTTDEVAEAVTWISTAAASGLTGQTIYVDAGYSSVVPVHV
jgi:enoyl-[acyl-carrier protein] reductase I